MFKLNMKPYKGYKGENLNYITLLQCQFVYNVIHISENKKKTILS